MEDLNLENFNLYAAKAYNKPYMVQSDFEEDLNRILYIKRLLSKYYSTGELKERLILNHIIVIGNVFGIEAMARMLWLKLEEKDWKVIKPFLLFLNVLPKHIKSVQGLTIETDDIELDMKVVDILRMIK